MSQPMPMFIRMSNKPSAFAKCDADDYLHLSQFRWLLRQFPNGFEYAVAQINGKRTYMHRYLAGVEGLHVDHINGDTLDNRRANLRAVTPAINAQNRNTRRASKTGVEGVFEQGGRYIARVGRNKKRVYLGSFKTADAAAQAVESYKAALAEGDNTVHVLLKRIARLESELASYRNGASP